MAINIGIIFSGVNLAKGWAEYLGLVESLDAKLDRLSGAELEAGLRSLEQASNSEVEFRELLREARSRFNKAVSLERSERLLLAYIGLALCHHFLDDQTNCVNCLREIEGVELKDNAQVIRLAAGVFLPSPIYAGMLVKHLVRREAFELVKASAREVLAK
jgi:hypothetical protein